MSTAGWAIEGRRYDLFVVIGDEGTAERLVPLERCTNFRDLGGYRARDGREVRWATVYRSDSLHRLSPADQATLADRGVRTVYDLRSDAERARLPSPFAQGVPPRVVAVPFAAGKPAADLLAEHGDDGDGFLLAVYRRILRVAAPAFGELVDGLAVPGTLPAVFHCAAGKDRTGLAAAVLLEALGVAREDVLDDYELSAACWDPTPAAEDMAALERRGTSPALVAALLGTSRPALATALDELDAAHGGARGYLTGPAGVPTATLDALAAALLA